jgi:hypothetical protein
MSSAMTRTILGRSVSAATAEIDHSAGIATRPSSRRHFLMFIDRIIIELWIDGDPGTVIHGDGIEYRMSVVVFPNDFYAPNRVHLAQWRQLFSE